MRLSKQFWDWDIKSVYLLFLLAAVLVDLLLSGGSIAPSEYFGGFRPLVIEVFLVGLVVTYSIEIPSRNRARQQAWDEIYDFKDGVDAYSQAKVRSAFRRLLSAKIRQFRFFPPKGSNFRDFSNLRIENAKIEKSRFIRVDLSRVKWMNLTFSDSLFKDVCLNRAVLDRCKFKRCKFRGVDFSLVDQRRFRSKFVNCEFKDCISVPNS